MKKAKFGGLNFGSAEVLLKDEQKKVNGGTYGYGQPGAWICFLKVPPYRCFGQSQKAQCEAFCGGQCTNVSAC